MARNKRSGIPGRLWPEFVVFGRAFWRLRKYPGHPGMEYWVTEEKDGGHEGSLLAVDLRSLPLWSEKFGDERAHGGLHDKEREEIVRDALRRDIDLVAHSDAWWRARTEADEARRLPASDLDDNIPF